MNKNTGDGELDKILVNLMLDVLQEASKVAGKDIYINTFPDVKAKTAIKQWAAQEANLAVINELENLKFIGHTRKQIKDRIAELSVIQNKLEGLS